MYYRMHVPLTELARHGHSVVFRSGGDEEGNKPIVLSEMQGYDIVIGQRFNHYGGLGTWRRARGPFNRLVYEIDDDVFSVTPANWQAFHVYSKPEIIEAVTHMASVADLITTTTEPLADVMRRKTGNENVAVLPNCVPGWLLDAERVPRQRPAIGWQGGASHGLDVGLIVGPVRRFLKRFPGWDFRLGGTDFRETFKAGDRAAFTPWIPVYEDAPGYYATIDFDIGLAPLLDSEFARAKSNVKVLEYAAKGIPSVASDCAVYRSFIEHGKNGFLVKREHEWLTFMSVLAGDDQLRRQMGEAARETARERIIEKSWARWEAAYEKLFVPR